jgi:hypothetical protein
MVSSNNNPYLSGSVWRKWDLHFHTPSSYDYDNKSITNQEIINVLEKENIEAVAITDHHLIDIDRINELKKLAGNRITIFPGIEFCSSSRGQEPIHFIGIFPENCNLKYIWDEIRSKTDIEKKKQQEGKKEEEIYCDLIPTSNIIKDLGGIISIHAGRKSNSIEKITNSLPVNMAEKEDIAKYVDIFELGQERDQEDYIDNVFPKIGKHPMIICSDNHNANEYHLKQCCWIKANPSFEGLKQILYEPEPGERVYIGIIKPDRKKEYQVIKKIIFSNTKDFPDEILFNQNLCSIIGSRSSGKSALINYLAHSIDKDYVEDLTSGPGEGEEFHWSKIKIGHSVIWGNGMSNIESPGKIVYIPQNFLFKKSKDPEEIKNKIEPVLFKYFSNIKNQYNKTKSNIQISNKYLSEHIENWFSLSDIVSSLNEKIKNLGNKKAIEKEKKEIQSKIDSLEVRYKLSKDELKKYQEINTKISENNNLVNQLSKELIEINHVSEDSPYFSSLDFYLSPNIDNLPKELQAQIKQELKNSSDNLLKKINQLVLKQKESIKSRIKKLKKENTDIEKNNKSLFLKYQKKIDLEDLINKLTEYTDIIKDIDEAKKEKKHVQEKIIHYEKDIKKEIENKDLYLSSLKTFFDSADQSKVKDINFGIEYEFNYNDIEKIESKVNLRDNSYFVKNHELDINLIFDQPSLFLQNIYSNEQKINVGNKKKEVTKEILTLTKNILFTAEMEGDKIGGFSETTMTPGRRALFLLKLILAESEDSWPILLDQPEDNLDSRSISREIVPFLKKKKKERQIIMISHNANLVIDADSEQVIITNRHGNDRPNEDGKQFNYLTGSICCTNYKDNRDCKDTLKSQCIHEHTCDILEGGKEAFERRRKKYNINKK